MALQHLQAGMSAPEFETTAEDGRTVSLADYQGRNVVLYFYPKDDTPGCTKQACALRDSIQEVQAEDAVVLGVSPDDEASHTKFIEKFGLPFSLLADTEKTLCEAYGVWGQRSFMGKKFMGVHRSLFVINAEGQLSLVKYEVAPNETVDLALQALRGED